MVKAFSDYARTPKLQLQPVDFNVLIKEVLVLYRHEKRAFRIETSLDPRLGLVDVDSGRIRQLIHNLVKNAIEALEGKEHALIQLESKLVDSPGVKAVELIVEDNGDGIPEDMMAKLFEPYISSKTKGSGLGLAIVKKIVEEHNGVIWADNLDTGGVRFNIRLPLKSMPKEQDQTNTKLDVNGVAG
jgi:nitrogen fixation/metabolism regulation signal transduction histidine kinase